MDNTGSVDQQIQVVVGVRGERKGGGERGHCLLGGGAPARAVE